MDVSQFALTTVTFNRVVDIAIGHLRERAQTKFQRVARAGATVNQPLVKLRLVHEPWLTANGRRRRIIGMRRQRDTRFLGDGHQRIEKFTVSPP